MDICELDYGTRSFISVIKNIAYISRDVGTFKIAFIH